MVRSMNGKELPATSAEMIAMEVYIDYLGELYAASSESRRAASEPPAFVEPDRAADPAAGKVVYEERCTVCHGADGQGLRAAGELRDG